ncbi:TPA: hypothetical protein ACH6H0_001596 [Campylobacter jejuni]|nr:hypothetical protein [Campylobacter jejuni]
MIWKERDLNKINLFTIVEDKKGEEYNIIELDQYYLVECIVCKVPKEFFRENRIYFLDEKSDKWMDCFQQRYEINKDCVEIILSEKYSIKFIRTSKTIVDLKIFTRKYKGLIISTRGDGFGCRIASMINAMYLSKKTGFKFGYSWLEFNNGIMSENSKIIHSIIEKEDKIFSKQFIEENSYTSNSLKTPGTYFSEKTLMDIGIKPYENEWGYFCTTYRSLDYFKDIDKDEYRKECKILWECIPFNQKYTKLISDAKQSISKLEGNWVAIHIRNGDSIYNENLKQLILLDVAINRIIPYQLVLKIIDELLIDNKKIVIFGPDIQLTFSLQMFYKNKNIYIADDFVLEEMSQMERTIYDFTLMSKAYEIYKPKDSLYSDFAYRIGDAQKAISINEKYTAEEMYNIIKEYDKCSIDVHQLQKAASYAYLYRLAQYLNKTEEEKLDILNKAIFLDPTNYSFYIEKIKIMFYKHNLKEVENILKVILFNNSSKFFEILFRKTPLSRYYHEEIICYFKNIKTKFTYCNYVIAKIHESQGDWNDSLNIIIKGILNDNFNELYFDYLIYLLKANKKIYITHKEIEFITGLNTMDKRVKNSLLYNLGFIFVKNYSSFKSRLKIPYLLYKCIQVHRDKRQNYKKIISKAPMLKLSQMKQNNIREVCSAHRHLSYKIGNVLMKTYNSKSKIKYICLFCNIKNIIKN